MAQKKKDAGTTPLKRTLRDVAEEQLARSHECSTDLKEQTPEQLIHELQVHQIELEIQAEELKRAHLALGESRDKYLDLYEFAPLGYLTLSDKALITNVNLTGATLLGGERSRLIKAPFSKFVAEKDSDEWYRYFLTVLKQEEKQICTLMLKRGDDSTFTARMESIRITGKNDRTPMVRVAISDITDIRLAEETARVHLAKYQVLFESVPLGITVSDKAGSIVESNRMAEHLLGLSKKDQVARQIDSREWHIIRPDGSPMPADEFASVRALQENRLVANVEMGIVKGEEDITWINVTAAPVPLEEYGVAIAYNDITDRKRVEEKLKESERFLTNIVEQIPDMIFVKDARDLRFVRFNKAGEDLLGYSRAEMLGKNDYDLFPRDEAVFFTGNDREVLLTNRLSDNPAEMISTHYKGERILHTKKIPIVDDKGVPQFLLGISEDITERKKGEDALRESELRYRSLFENMQEGVAFCRMLYDKKNHPTDFIYLNVNPAFNRIIGTSVVVGKLVTEVFPGIRETFPELFKIYGRVALTGKPESFDLDFKPSKKWLHISVYSPAKEHFVAIFEDITERQAADETIRTFSEKLERQVTERTSDLSDVNQKLVTEIAIRLDAEKQLTKSVGEKEVLLKEVHHRVKNNLQIIISLLNLQSRFIKDETTRSAFKESQNRVRAMALVHEKLCQSTDLAKLDLGNYLKFLGDNLFQFLGMKGKGITLTLDIHDISLAIDTAIPLGLIINELISNSLKYAFPEGRGGEIFLAIHQQDHTLTILYKDNGIGIPENFDWRNAESLGLRLVISLVEQLDGTIELERSSGTAFTIVVKEKE